MDLDERKARLLRAVVHEFIYTEKPVGSKEPDRALLARGLAGHHPQRAGRARGAGLPLPSPHQRRAHPH